VLRKLGFLCYHLACVPLKPYRDSKIGFRAKKMIAPPCCKTSADEDQCLNTQIRRVFGKSQAVRYEEKFKSILILKIKMTYRTDLGMFEWLLVMFQTLQGNMKVKLALTLCTTQ
jgi:hypothetical protein